MPEEMYLVPAELMKCFSSIGRLRKLQANISRICGFSKEKRGDSSSKLPGFHKWKKA